MCVVLLIFVNEARKQNIAYLFRTLRNGFCLQLSGQILKILGQSQANTGNYYKLYIFTLPVENELLPFLIIYLIRSFLWLSLLYNCSFCYICCKGLETSCIKYSYPSSRNAHNKFWHFMNILWANQKAFKMLKLHFFANFSQAFSEIFSFTVMVKYSHQQHLWVLRLVAFQTHSSKLGLLEKDAELCGSVVQKRWL